MILKQTGKLAPINEPWNILRDAINDLELQEQTEGVEISMIMWHEPDNGVCYQCLAGCVMSRRLGVDLEIDYNPFSVHFNPNEEAILKFLDAIRVGYVSEGLKYLNIDFNIKNINVTSYDEDPELFKYEMRDIADMLERELKD